MAASMDHSPASRRRRFHSRIATNDISKNTLLKSGAAIEDLNLNLRDCDDEEHQMPCESCIMYKHNHSPFNPCTEQGKNLRDLVQLDAEGWMGMWEGRMWEGTGSDWPAVTYLKSPLEIKGDLGTIRAKHLPPPTASSSNPLTSGTIDLLFPLALLTRSKRRRTTRPSFRLLAPALDSSC